MPLFRNIQGLALLLAIAACTLLAHPYKGISHDGTLYLGQVLLHTQVPALQHDLFFSGGSQDRYSIYAHVIAPLYKYLGLAPTHILVLACSWLLAISAVLTLLKRFDPTPSTRFWGVLAYAVLSPNYGGNWIFSYGEAFVTARSFAEPLLLWSLVALMAGNLLAAFALQVLAALFHPLMSLPVMVVGWCYLVSIDRRWLWLLVAPPLLLIAALAGLQPWEGLLRQYDPYWWALVDSSNKQVLLANWTPEDKLSLLLDITILAAVAQLRSADLWRRLLLALVAAGVLLLGLAAAGADLMHAVLLTQLQLWRVHWVMHLFAMMLSPWLLMRLWTRSSLWRVSACAFALALLNAHIGTSHGLATLALWALTSFIAWRAPPVSTGTVRLGCLAILACTLALSAYQIDSLLGLLHWRDPNARWTASLYVVAAFPTVAAAGFATLQWLARRHIAGAGLAIALSGSLLIAAMMGWDQRPDVARAVETTTEQPHPFQPHIPAHASVYWPNQLLAVWGLLQRESHYAPQQGAGVLFNRNTALILGPRKEMYRRITEDRTRCEDGASLARDAAARIDCERPSPERLAQLCSQPAPPGFVIVRGRMEMQPLAVWQPPQHHEPPQSFALYACSQLTAPGA